MKRPRIGSVCSGYGGLERGLQAVVGGTVAWHAEIDKHPAAVLAARFPGVPNLGDITTTDWAQVESVDWFTAGYPCQPFSGNGRRKGTNDTRHIWPHVLRAIRALRPGHVLLENVEDHLTLGFGTVLGDLAEAGFDAEWCVLRASDVGAPHGRPRLFIVATDTRRVIHAAAQPRGMAGAVPAEPPSSSTECLARPCLGHDGDKSRAHAHDFGEYAPAIRRWERTLGRRAPAPLIHRGDLPDVNPQFVEWAMGLDAGWVTDVPIPVAAQLKALGNGVVPQQSALAVRTLLNLESVAA